MFSIPPATLLAKLLEVTEQQIVPLTRAGVASGSKVFGAAILTRGGDDDDDDDGLSLVPHTVATNNERASPLLHGEINCIQTFFATGDAAGRPETKNCIFFCTHEPCSLCLSGITWAGFREFYYLFTYEDSRDLFAIPYDIDILESVFRVAAPSDTAETLAQRPLYNKTNRFFTSASLAGLVAQIGDSDDSDDSDNGERSHWAAEVARVKALYGALSATYQASKEGGVATSSVWK